MSPVCREAPTIRAWTKPKPETVVDAKLRRINVGTRPEIIVQRKAEIDRETADLTVAQQTYKPHQAARRRQIRAQSKLDK